MNPFRHWLRGPTTSQLIERNLAHVDAQLHDLELVKLRLSAQREGMVRQLEYLGSQDTVPAQELRDGNLRQLIHKGDVR